MKTLHLLCVLVCFNIAYSQSTRTEKLSLVKERPAKLVEITTDKTVFFEYFSKEKGLSNYSFGYGKPDFSYTLLKEDPNYPDYIASIEYHYKPVSVSVFKEKDSKGKESNTIVYESYLEATLHITDREKGLMHVEHINLKPQSKSLIKIVDNATRFNYFGKSLKGNDYLNSTFIEKNVSDINLKAYFKEDQKGTKTPKKNFAEKVNNPQIFKLELLAKNRLKAAFFKLPYNEYYTFHYIKKFKGFDIEPFNKGLSLIKDYVSQDNKDPKKVTDAITLWEGEMKKLDMEERRQKKLYISGLENLAKANYILGNNEVCSSLVNQIREMKKDDDYMSFYVRKNIAQATKEISYQPIPKKLFHANRFQKKDPKKINYIPMGKGSGDYFNMFLIKTLTEKTNKSLYADKQIFVAFNQLKPTRELKKLNKDTYDAIKAYKKEVKSLFLKQDYDAFFKGKSYEQIFAKVNPGIGESFRETHAKLTEDKLNLILDLYHYYANVIIVRNNNLETNTYKTLKASLKTRVAEFIAASENPRLEIFYEMNALFEDKAASDNIIGLSKKEVQNLKTNIINFCSLIKA